MKTSLLFLVFITSFFIRALRWLGVMQQKEYRFDRVFLFLRSKEGLKELVRLLPKKTDFSKVGLKRPKVTHRSLLLSLIFIVFSFVYFKVALAWGFEFLNRWYPYPLWYKFLVLLVLMVVYLFTIPVFAMLSAIPTVVLAYIQTYKRLFQAKNVLTAHKPKIIGITGSYGKTSTKVLLAHVLQKKYSVFMTPKSYNTKYSVANSVVHGYNGEEIAIIEYAAYKKGEIKELAKWIRPELAIITGLAMQHVGLFGSLREIISAKSELVASLPQGSSVVCNVYDEDTKQIFDAGSDKNKAKLIAVGPEYSDVKFESVRINQDGKLQLEWDGTTIKTQLIGTQYRELVHLVIVTALKLNVLKQDIISSLESFTPDEKFVYIFSLPNGARVVDDGDTSNPKGFSAMIKLAKVLKATKKVLVTPGIVDLGNDSKEIHLQLAQKSKKVFDQVVYVGDAGREEFKTVFAGELLHSSEQLRELISTLDGDDLVVIEGRMPAWAKEHLQ